MVGSQLYSAERVAAMLNLGLSSLPGHTKEPVCCVEQARGWRLE